MHLLLNVHPPLALQRTNSIASRYGSQVRVLVGAAAQNSRLWGEGGLARLGEPAYRAALAADIVANVELQVSVLSPDALHFALSSLRLRLRAAGLPCWATTCVVGMQ